MTKPGEVELLVLRLNAKALEREERSATLFQATFGTVHTRNFGANQAWKVAIHVQPFLTVPIVRGALGRSRTLNDTKFGVKGSNLPCAIKVQISGSLSEQM